MNDLNPTDAVVVAYVNSNTVTYSWHHSMIELIGHDMSNKGRIMQGGYIAIRHGTGGLVEARNKAVANFLADARADWLWWVDTDMGFAPDTVDRLFEAADPADRPIVGALCFSQREISADGMGGWRCAATPTIYDWVDIGDQQGFAVRWGYDHDSVVRCAGTGSACILIHRSVFEKINEKFGPIWYSRVKNNSMGELTSEDLSFCMHAGALGIPVHINTAVKTTHQKLLWLQEQDFLDEQRLLERPSAKPSVPVAVGDE
jgi:glycosyltransferase involved in cell wall biosynthesis